MKAVACREICTWATPRHFCNVVVAPGLGCLPIPDDFKQHGGEGDFAVMVVVCTNTKCSWEFTVTDVNGRLVLNQGCSEFAIAHKLKSRHILIFKKVGPTEFTIVIFDHTSYKVIKKCLLHPHQFTRSVVVVEP
jgi:hypothetical protein